MRGRSRAGARRLPKSEGANLTPAESPPRPKRLPKNEEANQREWNSHSAQIDPSPVALCVLGNPEKLHGDPHADRKPQRHPNEIASGLVGAPKGFVLWHADEGRDRQQAGDEYRPHRKAGDAQAGGNFGRSE